MLPKGLKLYTTRSQLCDQYVRACRKVYGNAPYVPDKLLPKFLVFEDDLRELGISTKDYATTVASFMKPFVLNKNMRHLPVNIFLSDYCLTRYMNISKTATVSVVNVQEDASMLYDELMVARLFIERNIRSDKYVRLSVIVDELRPLLSKHWLQVYNSRAYRKSEHEAVEQLAEEYRISKPVSSYYDIIRALL